MNLETLCSLKKPVTKTTYLYDFHLMMKDPECRQCSYEAESVVSGCLGLREVIWENDENILNLGCE